MDDVFCIFFIIVWSPSGKDDCVYAIQPAQGDNYLKKMNNFTNIECIFVTSSSAGGSNMLDTSALPAAHVCPGRKCNFLVWLFWFLKLAVFFPLLI